VLDGTTESFTTADKVKIDGAETITSRKIVKQASDLAGTLDSSIAYFIDGVIDMGSQTIEVPAGGLSIIGSTFRRVKACKFC